MAAAPIRLEAMDTQLNSPFPVLFPVQINTGNDMITIADSASFDALTPLNIPERIFNSAPIVGQIDHRNIPNNSTLQLSDGTLLRFNEPVGRGVDGSVYKITHNEITYCIKVSKYDDEKRFREIVSEYIINIVIYATSMNDNHYDCPYAPNVHVGYKLD